jgi:hypothetical protein
MTLCAWCVLDSCSAIFPHMFIIIVFPLSNTELTCDASNWNFSSADSANYYSYCTVESCWKNMCY